MTALENVSSNIPTQTAGVTPIVADDWNNYVKAGLTSLAGGHLICTSGEMSGAVLTAGMMFFDTASNQLKLYNGSSWVVLFDISASTSATFPVSTPVGMISPFAGATAPNGWMLCDGSLQSTSNYPALFAVIGTTYGSGSGTFGLPDLRGRSVFGKDNMGGTTASRITSAASSINGTSLGAAGGSQYIPIHGHSINHDHASFSTASGGAHQHTNVGLADGTGFRKSDTASTGSGSTSLLGASTAGLSPRDTGYNALSTGSEHTHSIDVPSYSGNTTSLNSPSGQIQTGGTNYANMPPGMILNYIIKY